MRDNPCSGNQLADLALNGRTSGDPGEVLKVLLPLVGVCPVCSVGPPPLASTVSGRIVTRIAGPVPAW